MLVLFLQFADGQAAAARAFHAGQVVPALRDLRQRFRMLWPSLLEVLGLPLPMAAEEPARPVAPPVIEDHFAFAAGSIASTVASIERIEAWQAAAADHIDAAEYALRRMLTELATAMPLPVDGAPLRAVLVEAATSPTASRGASNKALAA